MAALRHCISGEERTSPGLLGGANPAHLGSTLTPPYLEPSVWQPNHNPKSNGTKLGETKLGAGNFYKYFSSPCDTSVTDLSSWGDSREQDKLFALMELPLKLEELTMHR